jgi:hypothetical protein
MTVTTAPPPNDPIKGEPPVLNHQAPNEHDIVHEAGLGSFRQVTRRAGGPQAQVSNDVQGVGRVAAVPVRRERGNRLPLGRLLANPAPRPKRWSGGFPGELQDGVGDELDGDRRQQQARDLRTTGFARNGPAGRPPRWPSGRMASQRLRHRLHQGRGSAWSTERSSRSPRPVLAWSPTTSTGTLARAASLEATLPSRTLDSPAPLAPTTSTS